MQKPLRIATFNLENLDDCPGKSPSIDDRIAVLRPQLLRLEADILCLQEVNAQSSAKGHAREMRALDRLLKGTPYAGFYRALTQGRHHPGPADVHNLVILSRAPITAHGQVWHDLVPPPLYRPVTAAPPAEAETPVEWDRPILHAEVRLENEEGNPGPILHVINLRLRAPLASFIPGQKVDAFTWKSVSAWAEGFFLAAIKRNGQALEARMLIDRLFDQDPKALVVVTGDFNADMREAPIRAILGEEEDSGNGDLAARSMVAVERSLPKQQRFSVLHHGRQVMLDHILVSKQLMGFYRHVEIHNEALEDELVAFATVSRSPESFHAPVVAQFDFGGSAG